ncbi:hypothetical protein LINPERHAP2_LOCUS24927, partial [Linum perenne]
IIENGCVKEAATLNRHLLLLLGSLGCFRRSFLGQLLFPFHSLFRFCDWLLSFQFLLLRLINRRGWFWFGLQHKHLFFLNLLGSSLQRVVSFFSE